MIVFLNMYKSIKKRKKYFDYIIILIFILGIYWLKFLLFKKPILIPFSFIFNI